MTRRRRRLSRAGRSAICWRRIARVTAHLDAAAIAALLDPTAYTGLCAEMAREAAGRARDAVGSWEG